jgi:hypothetical protein
MRGARCVDFLLICFGEPSCCIVRMICSKTFSMEGFEEEELRGIIPRSVEEIFNCASAATEAAYCNPTLAHHLILANLLIIRCVCACCLPRDSVRCVDISNTAHTNVRFLVRASYLQIYSQCHRRF